MDEMIGEKKIQAGGPLHMGTSLFGHAEHRKPGRFGPALRGNIKT